MHGIHIDDKGDVWLAGAGEDDNVVLHYTQNGKYKAHFGRRTQWLGNLDKQTLGKPSDVYHDVKTGVVYVADGYINRRVLQFSSSDYKFLNYFGAHGSTPKPVLSKKRENHLDLSAGLFNTESKEFSDIIHCVVPSDDGLLYVCDRRHNRVQVFKRAEAADKQVEYITNLPVAPGSALAGTAADVAISPDQTFLYVADMVNGSIWIYKRDTLKLIGRIGKPGRQPGQFTWLHSITTDSKGNLYTTEVGGGMRVQKLSFVGMSH
jgi:DNA-binding beta-propeller fold protein YncE